MLGVDPPPQSLLHMHILTCIYFPCCPPPSLLLILPRPPRRRARPVLPSFRFIHLAVLRTPITNLPPRVDSARPPFHAGPPFCCC